MVLHGGAAYTNYITRPLTERVRRVDQQDDGKGLAVKAKQKTNKHLLHNNLDANRDCRET